jgi:hypothetical protein
MLDTMFAEGVFGCRCLLVKRLQLNRRLDRTTTALVLFEVFGISPESLFHLPR